MLRVNLRIGRRFSPSFYVGPEGPPPRKRPTAKSHCRTATRRAAKSRSLSASRARIHRPSFVRAGGKGKTARDFARDDSVRAFFHGLQKPRYWGAFSRACPSTPLPSCVRASRVKRPTLPPSRRGIFALPQISNIRSYLARDETPIFHYDLPEGVSRCAGILRRSTISIRPSPRTRSAPRHSNSSGKSPASTSRRKPTNSRSRAPSTKSPTSRSISSSRSKPPGAPKIAKRKPPKREPAPSKGSAPPSRRFWICFGICPLNFRVYGWKREPLGSRKSAL